MTEIQTAVNSYLDGRQEGSYSAVAKTALNRWLEWCRREGYETLADLEHDPTNKPMRYYAQDLRDDSSLSGSSANTYYHIVRACLAYAVRNGDTTTNPAVLDEATEELPSDDRDAEAQQYWEAEEIDAILRYVRDRAHEAIDERGFDATEEVRDRALVSLLVFSGVRGAEVFRDPRDDHEGRQGLRWSRVDAESGTLRVYGKAREWESASLLPQGRGAIERHRQLQQPPTEEWPLFPTRHAPTLYAHVREYVDSGDALLEDQDPMEILREHEVPPPTITTDGARRIMERLCEDAGIEPSDGSSYLKLHGARRALGRKLYRESTDLAQDVLRHRSPDVTSEAYAHVDAADRAEEAGEVVGDSWGDKE